MTSSPDQAIGYGAAMSELESILNRLEDDQLDIDELGDLVARGADLMALFGLDIFNADGAIAFKQDACCQSLGFNRQIGPADSRL